jgi:hypothetical protein
VSCGKGFAHRRHVPAHDLFGCCSKTATSRVSLPAILWMVMAVTRLPMGRSSPSMSKAARLRVTGEGTNRSAQVHGYEHQCCQHL